MTSSPPARRDRDEGEVIDLWDRRRARLPRLLASTALFGRSDDVLKTMALLADESVRLVTLTGRAGVGKTRLAVEVGWTFAAEGRVAVSFVPLAAVPGPELIFAEIASRLGLDGLGDGQPAAIGRRLAGSGQLLVLDNFEHVTAAAGGLEELLEAGDDVQVLVTSQLPLRLRFEHLVRVDPLPVPEPTVTDPMSLADQPSVALYCDRARAVDDKFRLTAHNSADVAELCRQLEGLPLSIELAAARAATLSAADVTARIPASRLDVLRAVRADVPVRQYDLRSAIGWTCQLLSAEELDLLLSLAVVGSSFDVDDVEAMSADDTAPTMDALSLLVDAHLIEPVGSNPARFDMRPSVRDFALEKLDAAGLLPAAQDGWIRWLARRARSAALGLTGADSAVWWQWIDHAQLCLLQALSLCIERARTADALELLAALAPHWDTGSYIEYQHLMDDVIEQAESREMNASGLAEALLWSALLRLRVLKSDGQEHALRQLRRGSQLADQLRDDRLRFMGLSIEMQTAPMTGRMDRCFDAGHEGLELARRLGAEEWIARFEVRLGMTYYAIGDLDNAVDFGMAGLHRARALADGQTVLIAALLLLPLVQDRPDLAAPLPRPAELLVLCRMAGRPALEVVILCMLAVEAVRDDRIATAADYCSQAFAISPGGEFTFSSGYCLVATLLVAAANGDGELVMTIHGRLRDVEPILTTAMHTDYAQAYQAGVDRIRRTLDSTVCDAAVQHGASTSWGATLTLARTYVRDSQSPESGPLTVPTVASNNALTDRQLEVVMLLSEGLTNKEIGARLGITSKTVMHHTCAIYTRLGVRGRSEAVAWAARAGVLERQASAP
jgi:predicted ATPase/DNA-binding NarL/FixJ family response regulator